MKASWDKADQAQLDALGMVLACCSFLCVVFSLCNGNNTFKPLNVNFFLIIFLLSCFFSVMTFINTGKEKAACTRFCSCTIPDPCSCFAFGPVKPSVELILFHRSWSQLSLWLQTMSLLLLPVSVWWGTHQDSPGTHVTVKTSWG